MVRFKFSLKAKASPTPWTCLLYKIINDAILYSSDPAAASIIASTSFG